jgi:DNA helicase TIP49 (TBP-interacting protein)
MTAAIQLVAPFAWGQVSETTTTTTTTERGGTITEYSPGSQIVLKETSGPRTYRFGKSVTYVTKSGKVLDPDVVKTKVRVGVPVHVHYVGTGDSMMVDRVIVDED